MQTYLMGTGVKQWNDGKAKDITFCVTDDCNLACTYCYFTHKSVNHKMSFETAKKAVDFILAQGYETEYEAVVWNFIGGEPTLEMDLISKISDYIVKQMYELEHPWFYKYMFNFSTNGLLYSSDKVQNYINRHRMHVSFGISLDGTKEKHNQSRVYKDGSGSYDDVMKSVPLWLSQFPKTTKATFSSSDLPYLKDSILHLWSLGIVNVMANVVFEDVWKEGDDLLFEQQLKALADEVLEKELWKDYSVRFFAPEIGFPLQKEMKKKNHCGAGNMLAVDADGNLYPCMRFTQPSLSHKKALCIGDIEHGIDEEKRRPFLALDYEHQNPEMCLNCDVASGCTLCVGLNYDESDIGTIYDRQVYHCNMHKANVRACEYFWNKFEQVTGLENPRKRIALENMPKNNKTLMILSGNRPVSHCYYTKPDTVQDHIITPEILAKAKKFAAENEYDICFVGEVPAENSADFCISHEIQPHARFTMTIAGGEVLTDEDHMKGQAGQVIIYKINTANLDTLAEDMVCLIDQNKRINLHLEDLQDWDENVCQLYKDQLEKIAGILFEKYTAEKVVSASVNVLTDLWQLESMGNCNAGIDKLTLAPNGKFYICPAFYDHNLFAIGDLENGIDKRYQKYLTLEKSKICSGCDAYHCKRCVYLNYQLTGELCVPSSKQCKTTHIEREVSRKLQKRLREDQFPIDMPHLISKVDYDDPIMLFKR